MRREKKHLQEIVFFVGIISCSSARNARSKGHLEDNPYWTKGKPLGDAYFLHFLHYCKKCRKVQAIKHWLQRFIYLYAIRWLSPFCSVSSADGESVFSLPERKKNGRLSTSRCRYALSHRYHGHGYHISGEISVESITQKRPYIFMVSRKVEW